MGRITGNWDYWEEVEAEMQREQISRKEAEVNMLYRVVKAYRKEDKMKHDDIQKILNKRWGLGRSGYYTRLRWIREVHALP